ncbi:MAG: SagB/ThcOx family dehydrogenase [Candidatus Omnitrophica bacterium]|nr:SagB/ThcOx family dehydrogenase [Candidatus Omnitrophota bacterium]
MQSQSSTETVFSYHQQTKHHFDRYASSLGYLDWATQPNPFRMWEGSEVIPLPLLKKDPGTAYDDLYHRDRNPQQALCWDTLGAYFELSLGISAWKSTGVTHWALRVNPSSGNLHPTEGYVILPDMSEVRGGVFHYNPLLHALERRATLPGEAGNGLETHFGAPGFLVVLTSVYWRESWKYGERGFRYSMHDAGHALGALVFSGALLGWRHTFLKEVLDEEAEALVGFDRVRWTRHEEEFVDAVAFVCTGAGRNIPKRLPPELVREASRCEFKGSPNRLSGGHADWEAIERVALTTRKEHGLTDVWQAPSRPYLDRVRYGFSASEVIRKRRSAVAMDGATGLTRDEFLAILDRTLPRAGCAPFDIELGSPHAHLFLFVHRVDGLDPGLYFLIRNEADADDLKRACHEEFLWQPVEAGFPLALLKKGDYRAQAAEVSCHQDIAGDSAFSLGQIARFRDIVEENPWCYRRLFWETGLVGQVLYLEAEALGKSATGIGCYFDDPVHELLGLTDDSFQSLYHFTVGGAVVDERLTTYSAYHHLKDVNRDS